jgi:imidazolonepropionase-like amidohydrolase
MFAACGTGAPVDDGSVAYVGALLIDGTGSPPVPDGALVVRDGRIVAVGPASEVAVPRGATVVDLSGRTVMPGMVNAHGHVGETLGLESGHYSEENVARQLSLYAAYGVTTVVSLGGDGEAGVNARNAQETPDLARARIFLAGEVVTGDTPEAALEVTERNLQLGADFIKFRIDDNLGTTNKMAPAVYEAVIARAREAGVPVAVHIFYQDDAKAALAAGADFIAHSVRDQEVDSELLTALKESGVCYSPTLLREVSTFVYGTEPGFFEDPFFQRHADPAVVEALRDPERQQSVRERPSSRAYEVALGVASANLVRIADAGVPIAFGTDTGPPGRFQGYFEHLELEHMVAAGMDPMAVIVSATGGAAACMGLDEVGTLETEKWADFLVLAETPLEGITANHTLEAVFVAGNRLDSGP